MITQFLWMVRYAQYGSFFFSFLPNIYLMPRLLAGCSVSMLYTKFLCNLCPGNCKGKKKIRQDEDQKWCDVTSVFFFRDTCSIWPAITHVFGQQ